MAACIICINYVELYEVVTGGGGGVSRCQQEIVTLFTG